MFFTYAHYTQDTNRLFYIGKGSEKRANTLSRVHRSEYWGRVADKHGVTVQILAGWPTEAEAFEHERFLINTFRSLGAKLTNLSDGGIGGATGAVKTPEHRAKIGAAHIGRVVSESTREKMRVNAARQFASPEAREAARIKQTGKKQSPETIAKKIAKSKGKKQTPEAVAARVLANKGFKHSPESLAKLKAIAFNRHLAALERKGKLCLISPSLCFLGNKP